MANIMYMIFNYNSDPQLLETREDFEKAKNTTLEIAKYFPVTDELVIVNALGEEVFNTNMGTFWRFLKA